MKATKTPRAVSAVVDVLDQERSRVRPLGITSPLVHFDMDELTQLATKIVKRLEREGYIASPDN